MDINTWLKNFKDNWQNHNISGVLDLFDKNIIYYETPFVKLNDFDSLAKEWEVINNQDNIIFEFEIFSSSNNKYSVIWKLQYKDQENIVKNFAGTYLIELNEEGKCTYFHHSCETM